MISHAPSAARRAENSIALQAAAAEAFDQMFLLDSPDTTEVVLVRHAEPDFRAAIKNSDADPPSRNAAAARRCGWRCAYGLSRSTPFTRRLLAPPWKRRLLSPLRKICR